MSDVVTVNTTESTTDTEPRRPTKVSAVAALAAVELRRLLRDRVALLFIIVMPVAVIVIIGATIGSGARHVTVGVIDEDGSPASQRVVQILGSSGQATVTTYRSRDELMRDVRTSNQLAALTIPRGFSQATSLGTPASVVISAVQEQDAQTVRPIVQSAVDTVATTAAATAFVGRMDAVDERAAADAVDRTAADLPAVTVQSRTVGVPVLESNNQFSYTAPSNLVLFLFITSVAGGGALVETRRLGIPRRMLAAPVGTGTIVLGFGLVRLAIALVQASLIIGVGSLVFDVSWGQPAGLAALVFVYALMAVGAGLAVGAVARSTEQATAIGIPVGIALGMLGGCMWPLDIVPPGLRAVGHVTPQAWAMDGLVGLVFNGKGITDIAGDIAVLAAYAAVLLTTGILLLRRTLVRSA